MGRGSAVFLVGLCAAVLTCRAAPPVPAERPRVRLGGGLMGERFALTERANILRMDVEGDFFRPFAERTLKVGFIGLGKLADALVHFAANSDDAEIRALKDRVIAFIVSNQQADGYTGCLAPSVRLKALWDVHEMGFVIQALVADWELFGNAAALAAARRNADLVIGGWQDAAKGDGRDEVCIWLRTIGFGYALARLAAATGEGRYVDFLRRERPYADWNAPIVIGRSGAVEGHAYAYLAACLEQLELNRFDSEARRLEPSRRVFDFLTKGDGLLVDGSGGICECWTDDQDGEGNVGETCMTAYLLLWCDELLKRGIGEAAVIGDLMERSICNALFAAQSRDGRRLRYYTPLNGVRKFWEGDLYCCPNNFRRAVSRLPEFVFHVRGDVLSADLYTACTARLAVGGVEVGLREETDYPRDGRVRFAFAPSRDAAFTFRVRLPRWCRAPSVRVNGAPVAGASGRTLDIARRWTKGDTVELDFPMEVRTVLGRKRQAGRFAVLRGPVVYALDTRSVPELREMHPHDVQTLLAMDPARLVPEGDGIAAFVTVAGRFPGERKVLLRPFSDEDNTLTYFRAPAIRASGAKADELLGGGS